MRSCHGCIGAVRFEHALAHLENGEDVLPFFCCSSSFSPISFLSSLLSQVENLLPLRHLFHKGVFVRNEERQKLPIEATKMVAVSNADGHEDLYKEQSDSDNGVEMKPVVKSMFQDSFEDSFEAWVAAKK